MTSTDARDIAMQLGMGFVYHDQRRREEATDAFATVDTFQFRHIDDDAARAAATAYVDALWEKDTLEDTHDIPSLERADWTPVRDAFSRRATAADIDERYANLSTVAWKRHKVGGDYWTPMQRAQMYELRAALQDPEYPHKPRGGQSGYGPEAVRYLLGIELHDMRRFEEALDVMTPYFERIAGTHSDTTSSTWGDIE